MTPLDAAKELVAVLEQLEALQTRRGELLAELAGADPQPPKTAVKAPRATRGKTDDGPPLVDLTSAEILANGGMGHRTPEEQAKIEDEAMDVYDANVQPASEAQKRMIFAMLGTDFGVTGDADKKAVIIKICELQHHGEKIESISKELSMPWATGVIDYLKKATQKDIDKMVEPF